MKMKSIFKVIIFILTLACFSNVLFGNVKQGNTRVINVGQWLKSSISVGNFDSYFDASLFQIETNDDCLMADLFFVGSRNGKLVIKSDEYTLYIIDSESGKIESKIDRRGNGPQEYILISYATVAPDKDIIYISDLSKDRVLAYDFKGNYISELPLKKVSTVKKLEDGNYVVCYFRRTDEKSCYGLYNKDFNLIRKSSMKKSEVDNFMLTVNSTSDYNGECFFQEYYSDVIYKVTSDVDIPYLTIDLGKYALPLEYYASAGLYNKNADDYIIPQRNLIVDNFLFYRYFYNRKMYMDVWNINKGLLISRTIFKNESDPFGFKITVNGVEVHCWPEFAVDDEIYCRILPNEAEKVSKDYSDENNPMLIKLTPKDR